MKIVGFSKRLLGTNSKKLSISLLAGFFVFAFLFGNFNHTKDSLSTLAENNSFGGDKVVVLDAGHGGMDGGAIGVHGEIEKDINLAIVKDLQAMLELSGYKVVLTREKDDSIHDSGITGVQAQKQSDMKNRKAIIDKYPNSVFISVHQNRFTDPQYFGAQMFYMEENPENLKLAQILQDNFAQLQDGNDREIKISDGMFLLRGAKQPAILAECGFLSNPDDASNLSDPDYQKKVAFTLYKGIRQFYEEMKGSENGEEPLYMQ